MSLRAKLIAGQLALLAVVCLIIGVVTVLSLRAFLLDQLDNQLAAASDRSQDYAGKYPLDPKPNGRRPAPPIDAPGQRDGTLAARVSDTGVVVSANRLRPESAVSEQLNTTQIRSLLTVPIDGRCYSRHITGLGEYRVTASHTASGDIVITGLPLEQVNETLTTAVIVLAAVSLSGLAVAGVAGTVVVRRMLRPLNRMATTAGEVAELPLHRGNVPLSARVPEADANPYTEVGQVGAALNRMLGHIDRALAARHASETRVRQFVADASHELRTPLASIRGYAELAARDQATLAAGGGDTPTELAHAIDRIGSESRRMTTLVDDLLLLARLDSGRPLERATVDLSRLVVDTVSDARVSDSRAPDSRAATGDIPDADTASSDTASSDTEPAGPEHSWRLVLPEEPVEAIGDEARLHQVLANLLSNARVHTPAGTTVVTELSTEPGVVVLRVSDDGPGIPEELRPDVFERFARGDESRSRAAGGTGLGLAIVAAVVHAHHGTVALDSRPGSTVFTIRLPAAGT